MPTVINENVVNNTMDNTTHMFGLRRSLRNARNARFSHRNRYDREFQYMQKSVENIRNGPKIKKQTKLNVKDKYRCLVGTMMNLISKDDEFSQVQYKEGIKRHGEKAVDAMFK